MTAPATALTRARTDPAAWGRHPLVRVPALALGGLIVAVLLAGGSFVAANVFVRTTDTATTTLTGDIRRADIHVTGQVTIRAGRPGRAEIDRRSTYGVTEPRITEELVDGLLTVRVECVGGLAVICTNDVTVALPPDVALSIDAMGTTVSDMASDIEVNSDAGAVEVDRVSGDLDLNVGGGSITGRDLASARVQAAAGAGSVELTFAVPPEDVDAGSGAGSVLVEVPPGDEAYRVDATAGAGADVVTVRTDPTSDRRIRASSGAGSVDVRYAP